MTRKSSYARASLLRLSAALLLLLALSLAVIGQDNSGSSAQELLDAAVAHLQAAESFRLDIEQSGAAYPLALTLDGVNTLPASLKGAQAQYLQPNELHIHADVQLFLPLSLDIYSRDDRQWLSFPSGAPWILLPAFEDFDVNRLLAPNAGIEYVLANLADLELLAYDVELPGAESEPNDEAPSLIHLRGRAGGPAVADLLFGFIEPQDDVELEAWINADDGRLALIEITMLETVGDAEDEPARWHIRFLDYDAPPGFSAPA